MNILSSYTCFSWKIVRSKNGTGKIRFHDFKLANVLDLEEFIHQRNGCYSDLKVGISTSGHLAMRIYGDSKPSGERSRRYNAPTRSEVGLLMGGKDFESRHAVLEKPD